MSPQKMGISRACASKWVNRYRQHGAPGLLDRSSAPRRLANARRLLKAYGNALAHINVSERELIEPGPSDAGLGTA